MSAFYPDIFPCPFFPIVCTWLASSESNQDGSMWCLQLNWEWVHFYSCVHLSEDISTPFYIAKMEKKELWKSVREMSTSWHIDFLDFLICPSGKLIHMTLGTISHPTLCTGISNAFSFWADWQYVQYDWSCHYFPSFWIYDLMINLIPREYLKFNWFILFLSVQFSYFKMSDSQIKSFGSHKNQLLVLEWPNTII